jgi:hypothetical protein
MIKTGSLCLKVGLQCFTNLPETYFAFDNLLITGKYRTNYEFISFTLNFIF